MKARNKTRKLAGFLAVVGATAVAPIVVLPAVTADAALLANYTPNATPTNVVSNATNVVITTTVTNNEPIGSFDTMNDVSVIVPSDFVIVSTPASVMDSNGATWTLARSGNTVTAHGSGGPGTTVPVPVTVNAPSGTHDDAIDTVVKGGINGLLGATWDQTGPDPVIHTGAGQPSALVFVQQPTDVNAGAKITPAITVKVVDAIGNTVTGYTTPITLTTAYNPNTGGATNPSGTLPQSVVPVLGVATFSNVIISDVGAPYQLKGNSGALNTPVSKDFASANVAKTCTAPSTCTATTSITNLGSVTVTLGPGANNDVFTASYSTTGAPNCAQTGPFGGTATFTSHDKTRAVTVQQTLDKKQVQANPDNGTSHYGICYQSLVSDSNGQAWITASGQPAATDGIYFYGFLADCSAPGQAPCLVSMTGTGPGARIATYRSIPGADPKGIFGVLG